LSVSGNATFWLWFSLRRCFMFHDWWSRWWVVMQKIVSVGLADSRVKWDVEFLEFGILNLNFWIWIY
jgi:hypothetical protein